MFAWGVAAFLLVPPLQHRVTAEAAGAAQLASTLNQSAFNLGAAVVCLALLPALLSREGARKA